MILIWENLRQIFLNINSHISELYLGFFSAWGYDLKGKDFWKIEDRLWLCHYNLSYKLQEMLQLKRLLAEGSNKQKLEFTIQCYNLLF